MSRLLRQTWTLVQKDLVLEWRTREVVYTAGLFALVLVTLFLFSGFETAAMARGAAPGVLWVGIAFTGALVFGRTFEREREDRAIQGLLLIPGIVEPLYLAKLIVNLVLLGIVELLLVPAVWITFRMDVQSPGVLLLCILLGTVGFCAMGTVLAATLATVRLRAVILPVLLYPLCIPLLVAATNATAALLRPGSPGVWDWLALMAAFDVLFVVLSRWLFGQALDHQEAA